MALDRDHRELRLVEIVAGSGRYELTLCAQRPDATLVAGTNGYIIRPRVLWGTGQVIASVDEPTRLLVI